MIKHILLLLSISLGVLAQLNQQDFSNEALLAHNLYRKIHGVQDLRLNPSLSTLAFNRAKELAGLGELNVKQNMFEGKNLGETVGSVGGFAEYNGVSATQLWYSVVSKYDEEGETSNEGASFTQIVWKNTREVGFGIAKGKDGKFYFVAEYFPSGNIRGQYADNVFQLSDELVNVQSESKSPCVNTIELIKKNNTHHEQNLVVQEQDQLFTTVSTPVLESDEVETTKRIRPVSTTTEQVTEISDLSEISTETSGAVPVKVKLTTQRVKLTEGTSTVSTTLLESETNQEEVKTTTVVKPLKVLVKNLKTTTPLSEFSGDLVTEQILTTTTMPMKLNTFLTSTITIMTPEELMNGDLSGTERETPRKFVKTTTTKVDLESEQIAIAENQQIETTTKPVSLITKLIKKLKSTTVPTTTVTTTTELVEETTTESVDVTESTTLAEEILTEETTTEVSVEQETVESTTVPTTTTVETTTLETTSVQPVEEQTTQQQEEATSKIIAVKNKFKKLTTTVMTTTVLPVEEEVTTVQVDEVQPVTTTVASRPALFKKKKLTENKQN